MSDCLLVVPTYNELDTLPKVLDRLHHSAPDIDVLVVDDGSPDGTGQWAEEFVASNPWCSILQRGSKQGLASAYIDGFRWGIGRGYLYVGQMDADGSHRPEQLTRLLMRARAIDHPAGVIGSRWTRGGGVTDWAPKRIALSQVGNVYVKLALGMRIKDATAGFRVYRSEALVDSGVLDELTVTGYGYQVEMTYRLTSRGLSVVEVPITFDERLAGQSKMSWNIAIEELCQVTRWGVTRVLGNG